MALTKHFLDRAAVAMDRLPGPLVLPWPIPGNPAAPRSFTTFAEWREFVYGLGLRIGIPTIVAAKFERAQKLYLLAWIDFDIIKAGELVALTTLELALQDRYGGVLKERRRKAREKTARKKQPAKIEPLTRKVETIPFADLLKYLLEDGLTDEKIPMVRRCGGSVLTRLTGECEPGLADIRNSLSRPAKNVVAFYNKRGTCEQWIKEGKGAIKWTRLSCRSFAANAVRLQLHALAYNLGNFLRTLATPEPIKDWTLTSLKEKLIKIGAKVVRHGRYVAFQMAEVAIPRNLFTDILRLVAELRPPPVTSTA